MLEFITILDHLLHIHQNLLNHSHRSHSVQHTCPSLQSANASHSTSHSTMTPGRNSGTNRNQLCLHFKTPSHLSHFASVGTNDWRTQNGKIDVGFAVGLFSVTEGNTGENRHSFHLMQQGETQAQMILLFCVGNFTPFLPTWPQSSLAHLSPNTHLSSANQYHPHPARSAEVRGRLHKMLSFPSIPCTLTLKI